MAMIGSNEVSSFVMETFNGFDGRKRERQLRERCAKTANETETQEARNRKSAPSYD